MRNTFSVTIITVLLATAWASAVPAAEQSPSVWEQRRVLNVAHAGGDLEAPHSTLFAMKTAVAAGSDVLEMDVRLSADGVLMVHHDTTVDRTTEATGLMGDLTAAELGALDNAYWFVPNCWSCHGEPDDAYRLRGIRTGDRPPPEGFAPSDFAIPTLAEVAEAFPDRILDVEIKDGPTGIAAADALAAFIAAHGPDDRYLVASFDDTIMAHFKSLAPDVATSPGLGETTAWFADRGPLPGHRVLQVPPTFSGIEVVTQDFVDDAHANGLAVWVWFNGNDDDTEIVWQHLIDLGVDALLTGKPAAAEATIEAADVGFAVATHTAERGRLRGRQVTLDVTCPTLHVDTCTGDLTITARHRRGHVVTIASAGIDVARGATESVSLSLWPGVAGAVRSGPVAATAAVRPTDGDTASTISRLELRRR